MKPRKRKGKDFWNREYKHGDYLALSTTPSEDLIKFTNWLERRYGRQYLNPTISVLDLGCGNGRNLVYLAQMFGLRGIGYDTAKEALTQAKELSQNLPLTYTLRSISEPLPLPDASQTLVLDMMSSHLLKALERERLGQEIVRILKPNGWLFFKTFLRDDDLHTERLLKHHPGEEPGSYIHPELEVEEHVFTEAEIIKNLEPYFTIHKTSASHRHRRRGQPFKRRSISIYAQKINFAPVATAGKTPNGH